MYQIDERTRGGSRGFPVIYQNQELDWASVEDRAGIYAIINHYEKKVYIGSSVDIRVRLGQHRVNLLGGKHECTYMQTAWNKRNAQFEFRVLEFCPEALLNAREQMFITAHLGRLYNQYKFVGRKNSKKDKLAYFYAARNQVLQRELQTRPVLSVVAMIPILGKLIARFFVLNVPSIREELERTAYLLRL